MLKAKDIMTTDVATIDSSATVADAMELMKSKGLRGIISIPPSKDDAYGIITETDIVYKVKATGKDASQVKVSEVATKPCIVVNPDLSVDNVAKLFANTKIRRAPVIQEKLLGIISITDLLRKG